MDPVTETPMEGTTEEWVIVNPTADTHPIHLHLVQFQLVSRQTIDAQKYNAQWMAIKGMPPIMTGGPVTPGADSSLPEGHSNAGESLGVRLERHRTDEPGGGDYHT